MVFSWTSEDSTGALGNLILNLPGSELYWIHFAGKYSSEGGGGGPGVCATQTEYVSSKPTSAHANLADDFGTCTGTKRS